MSIEIHIYTPPVAEDEIELDLCELTRIIVEKGLGDEPGYGLGGHWGYGTNFENDVFMIHSFCYCEQDDCPWCASCSCEYSYYIDNKKVTYEEWVDFYEQRVPDIYNEDLTDVEWEEHFRLADEVNKHRTTKVEVQCENCKNGLPAPNFLYKPTNLRIHWYKWIGRSMEYNREVSIEEWKKIFNHCVESLE